MIGVFLGSQSSGKTLSAVYFTYDYYKQGYEIYSNLNLKFPHTKLTHKLLIEYTKAQKQFNKAIFFIDEMYLYLDARSSISGKNKIFSYFALQTSKRNCHLLGTAQLFRTLDVRIRENTTFQVFNERVLKQDDGEYYPVDSQHRKLTEEENERLYIKNCLLKRNNEGFDYTIEMKKFYIKAKPIFDLYDTRELLAME